MWSILSQYRKGSKLWGTPQCQGALTINGGSTSQPPELKGFHKGSRAVLMSHLMSWQREELQLTSGSCHPQHCPSWNRHMAPIKKKRTDQCAGQTWCEQPQRINLCFYHFKSKMAAVSMRWSSVRGGIINTFLSKANRYKRPILLGAASFSDTCRRDVNGTYRKFRRHWCQHWWG